MPSSCSRSPAFFASSWILCSIGSPWQSHPGTYGVRHPASVLNRRSTSFNVLLITCPMWMSPLANGGPSCSTHSGPSARAACTCPYRSIACHAASRPGSFAVSLASIGKAVCGRFSVCL